MISATFPLKRKGLRVSRRLTRASRALVCLLTDRIDRRVMARGPNLKIIANVAAGLDNVDLGEATRRGIMVTNTPDVLTETTADLAWALLMATARRVVEADPFLRAVVESFPSSAHLIGGQGGLEVLDHELGEPLHAVLETAALAAR